MVRYAAFLWCKFRPLFTEVISDNREYLGHLKKSVQKAQENDWILPLLLCPVHFHGSKVNCTSLPCLQHRAAGINLFPALIHHPTYFKPTYYQKAQVRIACFSNSFPPRLLPPEAFVPAPQTVALHLYPPYCPDLLFVHADLHDSSTSS